MLKKKKLIETREKINESIQKKKFLGFLDDFELSLHITERFPKADDKNLKVY